jgi:GNAT superfamily N-acetyltransferase
VPGAFAHDTSLRRLCATLAGYFELGNESFERAGGLFVRNLDCPTIYDANQVATVRGVETPGQIDDLLAEIHQVFLGSGHRKVRCDPLTPPAFEARLVAEGYTASSELQMLLEGELRTRPREARLRPAQTDEDWSTLERLTRLDHEEMCRRRKVPLYAERVTREMVATRRAKTPTLRFWLAREDGTDCAFLSAWPGIEGVGQVESLFTHPEFRGRGLATALIACCVEDARERGAGPILIGAEPEDTPKAMYAALGFRPTLMVREYLKHQRG